MKLRFRLKRLPNLNSLTATLQWLLKLGLPLVLLWVVNLGLTPLAMALVILVKWRVLAVKYHWWWTRIRANIVDVFVGLSIVGFMDYASNNLKLQFAWAAVYILWLAFVKPASTTGWKITQGLIGQTLGVSVLIYSTQYPQQALGPVWLIIGIWVVSYFAARHTVGGLKSSAFKTSWPIVWGLFSTQLTVILLHWQLWLWFIPQLVMLQLVINLPVIIGFRLQLEDKLRPATRSQLIGLALALVVLILLLSDWQSRII